LRRICELIRSPVPELRGGAQDGYEGENEKPACSNQ